MSEPVGAMHHVGIVVRDLDRAEAFATGVLGLPVAKRLASEELGMRAVFLTCGPALVELVEFADQQVVQARLGDRDAAIDHVALEVGDLEATMRALAEHGVATQFAEPAVTPAGRTNFTTADTSAGVVWQLLELSAG
jgi:catechol 2,3-dioxygenase-like lactoylglutathione lyase family enzyme